MAQCDKRDRLSSRVIAPQWTRKRSFNIWYWVAAFAGLLLLQFFLTTAQVAQISYSEFEQYLNEGRITQVEVSERHLRGNLDPPLPGGESQFSTVRVEPETVDHLAQHDVEVVGRIEDTFLRDLLSWMLPLLLFIGIWIFLLRRMAGGMGGGDDADRQEQGQDLRPDRYQGQLR